MGKLSHWVIIT